MSLQSLISRLTSRRVPPRISQNFRQLDVAKTDELAASLKHHYFTRPIWGGTVDVETYLSSDEGKKDMSDHVHGRLDVFRRTVIPWLDDAKPLAGANILEIGCGTGSSSIALAEQGATVTGVDIDEDSLIVARDRARIYGLDVDFLKANATEAPQRLANQHFDFIIFFACLEHMTHEERIASMRSTWNMLSRNDLWCVIDTPNRLWHFDAHTSQLPFYFWLPDDLAFEYSRFSPRKPFSESYSEYSDEAMLSFLRHGRGLSYHEFDLAIKKAGELDVVSSLPLYIRRQNPLWNLGRRLARSLNYRYETLLIDAGTRIHKGFYQATLDLIIRKE